MKFIPNAVTRKLARQLLVTQKNSPTLLFGAGVVGMVTSTVLACRATLKVDEVLDKTEADLEKINITRHVEDPNHPYTEKDARRDKCIVYVRSGAGLARLYAPSIVIGAFSIAALVSGQRILIRRNAAVTAAYAALDKGFREYRNRVTDAVGPEAEREIYHNVNERREETDPNTGKKTVTKHVGRDSASIYARFFDSTNRNWQHSSEYNFMFFKVQQDYATQLLNSRGHVFLNEVYDNLGLERTPEGAVVGWLRNGDGDGYVDFGIFDTNNPDRVFDFMTGQENCILLDFNVDGIIYDKI